MFELEAAVSAWRRQMKSHGRTSDAAVVELEDHLREQFARLVADGAAPAAAWATAVERLGEPASLCVEFAKVRRLPLVDRVVFGTLATLAGLTLLGVAGLSIRELQRPAGSVTLAIHVSLTTFGYVVALVVALAAAYRTFRRLSGAAADAPLTATAVRFARLGSTIAAACTALGFVFGAAWSVDHLGTAFSASPREFGGLLVGMVCLVGATLAQRRDAAPRTIIATAALGGGAVLTAWAGPIAWESGYALAPSAIVIVGLTGSLAVAAVALSMRDDAATLRAG